MAKHLIVLAGKADAEHEKFILNNKGLFDKWETIMVSRGNDVLEMLENNEIDIIFCELELDDMSGLELFKSIQSKYPSAVRYLLVEQLDARTMLDTEAVVHQYVKKTIETPVLERLFNKSLGLRRLFTKKALLDRISSIETLPSPPDIYNSIVAELKSDNSSTAKIAGLISKDIGITTKLLKLVNSAYFGLRSPVESVDHAVKVLGLDTVNGIVLAAGVFNQFDDPGIPGFSIDRIYSSCTQVGARARLLAHLMGYPRGISDEALMAGMLHDIGRLIMLAEFQDELVKAANLAKEKEIPLYLAEREIMGVDDAKIGAYLLSLWGLSDSVVEAVACHASPGDIAHPEINTTAIVHLAYAFYYNEKHNIHLKYVATEKSTVDIDYITLLGLYEDLPNLAAISAGAVS